MDTTIDDAAHAENDLADYCVCMKTDAGWVYLSEFRTLQEAVQIAESAHRRTGAVIVIRQSGRKIRVFGQMLSSAID